MFICILHSECVLASLSYEHTCLFTLNFDLVIRVQEYQRELLIGFDVGAAVKYKRLTRHIHIETFSLNSFKNINRIGF